MLSKRRENTRPNNADDLKEALRATWASITPTQCQSPPCQSKCIQGKGGPSKDMGMKMILAFYYLNDIIIKMTGYKALKNKMGILFFELPTKMI